MEGNAKNGIEHCSMWIKVGNSSGDWNRVELDYIVFMFGAQSI